MQPRFNVFLIGAAALAGMMMGAAAHAQQPTNAAVTIPNPSKMLATGKVDARFASYNVEMAEITGGRFWRPYPKAGATKPPAPSSHAGDHSQPPGTSADLYQYRPPINLGNPRLVKLARALGPSYLRVRGTWANRTWFQDDDQPARTTPPDGFGSVLTRAQWRGVLNFLHATGDSLVTSFAVSAGTRNASGAWTPEQARAILDFTRQAGGTVAAAEFMNEPTFPEVGGAPKGYDAAQFARDAKSFAAFLRTASPGTVFLGPGGVGEGPHSLLPPGMQMHLMKSDAILAATGPIFDAFSYHFYGAASRRCQGRTTVAEAMSDEWLDRTVQTEEFYAALRDRYIPGKPIWLTETAEAACGGDPFAGQFADVFRYLNQLGALAQRGVQAVMHNTLAASDYGLLDEQTLEPRPDYWATLEWKRTMGQTVLDPALKAGKQAHLGVRLYAQCAPAGKGAVTVLVLNTRPAAITLLLPTAARQATLTASSLTSTHTLLNGKPLATTPDGSLLVPNTVPAHAGKLTLPATSATFLTFPQAGNAACQ
jgi:hypothetical protein